MHYLSMAAMFKDETKWLREWIEYHRLVGFEHFYLYTNEADLAGPRAVLGPYLDTGVVELSQAPGFNLPNQVATYTEIARRVAAAHGTVWLAFFDLDEFLLPIETVTAAAFLKEFEEDAALAVNWRIFGSAGRKRSPESQVRGFLQRAPDDFGPNRHVKVIVRPDRVGTFDSPHSILSPGFQTVNERHEPVRGPFGDVSGTRIRLNHYCVRSREDFDVKRTRTSPGKESWAFFDSHDRNDVFDDLIMRRYGAKLAEALARAPGDSGV